MAQDLHEIERRRASELRAVILKYARGMGEALASLDALAESARDSDGATAAIYAKPAGVKPDEWDREKDELDKIDSALSSYLLMRSKYYCPPKARGLPCYDDCRIEMPPDEYSNPDNADPEAVAFTMRSIEERREGERALARLRSASPPMSTAPDREPHGDGG